ncbi:MAG TPA: hypothetical protein VGC18_05600 [Lacisediminihabitans sp.]|uniref:hypothetical protein n=1 Tax=Lacisediminihabitans sp. TaxID=2787631 RepID=UPI002EDB5BB5
MTEPLDHEDLALDDVGVALPGAAELRAVGQLVADVDVHGEVPLPFADDGDGDLPSLAASSRVKEGNSATGSRSRSLML